MNGHSVSGRLRATLGLRRLVERCPWIAPDLRGAASGGARSGALRGGALLSAIVLFSACGQDPLTAYDIRVNVIQDCSQAASSAVQCVDEEELANVTRYGRWFIEDLGGANALRPVNDFILTTDLGRSLTGIHFPDNLSVAETESCKGEGGECYFARTQRDTRDDETECLETQIQAYDFRIDLEGNITGLTQDARITPDTCGTPFVTQVLAEITGTVSDEVVSARSEL